MNLAASSSAPTKAVWVGHGSTKIPPPAEYWAFLAQEMPGPQIERLKEQSDQRHSEFTTEDLPAPEADALALLIRFASDGWVERRERHVCPECAEELNTQEITAPLCPRCGKNSREHGGVVGETVFVRAQRCPQRRLGGCHPWHEYIGRMARGVQLEIQHNLGAFRSRCRLQIRLRCCGCRLGLASAKIPTRAAHKTRCPSG